MAKDKGLTAKQLIIIKELVCYSLLMLVSYRLLMLVFGVSSWNNDSFVSSASLLGILAIIWVWVMRMGYDE